VWGVCVVCVWLCVFVVWCVGGCGGCVCSVYVWVCVCV